jgi:hypothetical protein
MPGGHPWLNNVLIITVYTSNLSREPFINRDSRDPFPWRTHRVVEASLDRNLISSNSDQTCMRCCVAKLASIPFPLQSIRLSHTHSRSIPTLSQPRP